MSPKEILLRSAIRRRTAQLARLGIPLGVAYPNLARFLAQSNDRRKA